MKLLLVPNTFAICRLAADAPIPTWATGDFVSITRTADELSIVCPQDHVPDDVKARTRMAMPSSGRDFGIV